MTGVLIRKGNMGRQKDTRDFHTHTKKGREDTRRRRPSASEGEKSQEKPKVPTL